MFSDKEIKNAFVCKIYTIFSLQLLFIVGLIAISQYIPPLKPNYATFIIQSLISGVSLSIILVPLFTLTYVESTRRSFPTNLILLSVLTIGTSMTTANSSYFYQTKLVLFTMTFCTIFTISVTIFAKLSCYDMTCRRHLLWISTIVHLFFGMILIFVIRIGYKGKSLDELLPSILLSFVICIFLMYDTHRIMSEKYEELSPKEYFIGAILLYLHFVQLFLAILYIYTSVKQLIQYLGLILYPKYYS